MTDRVVGNLSGPLKIVTISDIVCTTEAGGIFFLSKKNRELHHRRRHRRDRGLEPRCNVGVVRVRPPVDRGYMIYESLKWSMLSRSQRPSLKTLQSSQEVIKLCL